MNTLLLVIQLLLALVFAVSGTIILILPNKTLAPRLSWVTVYSRPAKWFICMAKIAGALGLVLPLIFPVLNPLAPLAACGIASIMVLAFLYHLKRKEYRDLPATVLFFVMALVVAWFRFWYPGAA